MNIISKSEEHGILHHIRAMARNNAWSNERLLNVCLQLSADAFTAPRCGFFPSICKTLNHILTVDWYYLDAFECGGMGLSVFEPEVPYLTCDELMREQSAADVRLVKFCELVEFRVPSVRGPP